MTEAELKTYEAVDAPHGKWWLPLAIAHLSINN